MEPHFRYCCSVWGCAGSSEINQLQKLQKHADRIITNSSFDAPSRPLIEKLGWKTVDQLISSESKTMVFKSLNELVPQYLCDLFTRKSLYSSYSLRNTGTDLRSGHIFVPATGNIVTQYNLPHGRVVGV